MNQRTSAFVAFSSLSLLVVACDRQAQGALSNSAGVGVTEPIARVPDTVQTTLSAAKPAPEPSDGDPMSKLDSDMKAVLDQLAALNGKPIESLDALEARKQPSPADAVKALLLKEGKSAAPDPVEQVSEHTAQLSSGALPIRIYTPRTGKAPYPVILYFHGGGFVIANNDAYDASARALANGAEAVLLAAEYRKAPENKFPAAHDDAIASYEWTLRNAPSFGGNPRKVAVVGESAGGNLALNVSIAARDKHERLPVWEVLVYPVAGADMSTASYTDNANAKPLNKAMMVWFTDKYFRTPADAKDKRIDLLNADLSGLPPTTIINAEVDPLRSEGELLAARMRDAKVDVQQKTYAGVTHEFFGMGAAVGKAKEAMDYAVSKLKSAFAK